MRFLLFCINCFKKKHDPSEKPIIKPAGSFSKDAIGVQWRITSGHLFWVTDIVGVN